MKKVTESSQNKPQDVVENHLEQNQISLDMREKIAKNYIRPCPSCNEMSIKEMPGGRDAVCKFCGYKDPCCYD